MRYHIGSGSGTVFFVVDRQVQAGLLLRGDGRIGSRIVMQKQKLYSLTCPIPRVRRTLATDVEAAYLGHSAAQTMWRSNQLLSGDSCFNLLPYCSREAGIWVCHLSPYYSGLAHTAKLVSIFMGAEIGEYFTIDHGAVVIGATCIGKNVKLYQGVTLGAKSFPLEISNGNPVKNNPRHPILHDNVIVYSNATPFSDALPWEKEPLSVPMCG